jgi:hypothetical protein
MYVLVKVGRYAGELRDIAPEAAHAMIADGRAENPYDLSRKAPAVSEPAAPTEKPSARELRKKKKGGRR